MNLVDICTSLDEPSVKHRRDEQTASNLQEARAAARLKAINTIIMFVSVEELCSTATFGAAPPPLNALFVCSLVFQRP